MNLWTSIEAGKGVKLELKREQILASALTSFVDQVAKKYIEAGARTERLQHLPFGRRPGDNCMRDLQGYGFDGQAPVTGFTTHPTKAIKVRGLLLDGVCIETGLEFSLLHLFTKKKEGYAIYGGFMPREPELLIPKGEDRIVQLSPGGLGGFEKLRGVNQKVYEYLQSLSPYPVKRTDLDDLFLIPLVVPREVERALH